MSFAALISLIRGARAVLFPSLYEGFGLPVLEAMSLGTPVLTSNRGSLSEVAGDASLQLDPYDTIALSKAIHMMDSDRDWRQEASRRGVERARLFDRKHYDTRLKSIYDRLGVL